MSAARSLREILGGGIVLERDVRVTDITLDSRAVRPGGAFLACRGRAHHGLEFAESAVAAGASVILWEPDAGVAAPSLPAAVTAVAVPRLSAEAGFIADRFFGAPTAGMAVAGITGTNGKTTCAWLLAQALEVLGAKAAYFGTLGQGRTAALRPASHTTVDAVSLQRALAAERAAGVQYAALEVSSHALDQQRCAGVRFRVAAFTNLSRDHLDYHGDMASYAAAKARLFQWPGLQAAVINVDDAVGAEFAARLPPGVRLIRASRGAALAGAGEWLRAAAVAAGDDGLRLELQGNWGEATLHSPLLGDFNADNLLTVLGVLLALGQPLAAACAALARCGAAPGRMEALGGGNAPLVVVDYAHTPDALGKALRAARRHARGQLWCVFGCGGERDAGKRPMMGRVAGELADHVIITDDNPRGEDAAAIAAAIAAGMPGGEPEIVHDRAAAIGGVLRRARAGDVVLIAGKGHERLQIVGAEQRPFHDVAIARAFLEERTRA